MKLALVAYTSKNGRNVSSTKPVIEVDQVPAGVLATQVKHGEPVGRRLALTTFGLPVFMSVIEWLKLESSMLAT